MQQSAMKNFNSKNGGGYETPKLKAVSFEPTRALMTVSPDFSEAGIESIVDNEENTFNW